MVRANGKHTNAFNTLRSFLCDQKPKQQQPTSNKNTQKAHKYTHTHHRKNAQQKVQQLTNFRFQKAVIFFVANIWLFL